VIRLFLVADIAKSKLPIEEGYERMLRLLDRLKTISLHFEHWFLIPESARQKSFSLTEQSKVQEIIARRCEARAKDTPNLPFAGGFSAELTNVGTDQEWRQPGSVALMYQPDMGDIRFEMKRPEDVLGSNTRQIIEDVLFAICELEDVTFACCNVSERILATGKVQTYQIDFSPFFPHRKFFGWMGFVPRALNRKDVPEAASLKIVPKKGTLLVAVDDVFDLNNPAQIRAAHELEMKLVDLDLLPVTDPNFLS